MEPYSHEFFSRMLPGTLHSARRIVPRLVELFRPRNVVDIGCGPGAWLSVFRVQGILDVLGIDGSRVDPTLLQIPVEQIRVHDLGTPVRLDRKFDLAISLEVAEHLPASCAEVFVDNLVALAPLIVFSAAIPFQGGTNHLNEQWPAYWTKRFETRGYRAVDCLRREFWNDAQVEWWYSQNMLVFCRKDQLEKHPFLQQECAHAQCDPLALVHPRLFLQAVQTIRTLQQERETRTPTRP